MPKFEDFAKIEQEKHGANVLARHTAPDGKSYILMACQNFGAGRSMVLATDPLWRWKLKTPSGDNSCELFWRNLFSYLSLGKKADASWHVANRIIHAGEPLELEFFPASFRAMFAQMKFELQSPDGTVAPLTMTRPPSPGAHWRASQSFAKPGSYTCAAYHEGKRIAELNFFVTQALAKDPEQSATEPDLARMEEFAMLPNVGIADGKDLFDAERYFPGEEFSVQEKHSVPLWHTSFLYLLIAGMILLEWIVRRKSGGLL
ncbi:MAG: hypothetical protein PHS41_02530 [Victivallaceae bacterium]|nr:hypothetical protein [Victivallaceae bacterium]